MMKVLQLVLVVSVLFVLNPQVGRADTFARQWEEVESTFTAACDSANLDTEAAADFTFDHGTMPRGPRFCDAGNVVGKDQIE